MLAAAGLAEGTSFARAYRQMRGEARTRRTSLTEHVRTSPDITVKAALFEDSVAIVGLVLAAAFAELYDRPCCDSLYHAVVGALVTKRADVSSGNGGSRRCAPAPRQACRRRSAGEG